MALANSTHPLNIALYADIFQPGTSGGVDAYFAELVAALVTHQPQHRYTVLAPHPRLCAEIAARFAPLDVRVHCLNVQPGWERLARHVSRRLGFRLPTIQRDEARAIDRLGFDLVSFPRNVVFVPAIQTPVALHLFDLQHEYMPDFFPADRLAERQRQYGASIARADVILVSTDFTRQTLLEKTSALPEQIVVAYPGLAPSWQRAAPDTIAAVKARCGLPESYLYYPANPWPHKNHVRLLAALRTVRERHGLVIPLVLSGRLLYEPASRLQSLAEAEGVASQVTDLGFIAQEDLPAVYSAARCVVIPSLFEGFGMPLLEAMACGCPVACANATCLPEVAGGAALMFDPLDVDALADAVRRLWHDADLRADLVARGHDRVRGFSWAASTAQIVAAYRQIVKPSE